jgi:hypothetical protein
MGVALWAVIIVFLAFGGTAAWFLWQNDSAIEAVDILYPLVGALLVDCIS